MVFHRLVVKVYKLPAPPIGAHQFISDKWIMDSAPIALSRMLLPYPYCERSHASSGSCAIFGEVIARFSVSVIMLSALTHR